MSPQTIEINEKLRRKYIQELENWICLKEQKILENEEKIKSETSLSRVQKYELKISINLLKKKISKQTKILIRFKNGEHTFSDLKSIWSIMAYANSKSKSSYELINQLTSNSQDKSMQNVLDWQQQSNEPGPSRPDTSEPVSQLEQQKADLDDVPTLDIPLNPETIFTFEEQIAQLIRESSFSSSHFDDLTLNSPQPGPSRPDTSEPVSQIEQQKADLGDVPTLDIPLNPDPIIISDEQTAQLMDEYSFSPSDFNDIALNSPQPGSSSLEPRLQSLTQKQSCEKITQSGANLQNLQQEVQKTNDFPRRAIANWVDKQKQQTLPSSQQKKFYVSKTREINTTHSHNVQSAISTSDEYLKSQLQSTNETNLNQKKVPEPESIPTRSTVIVEVPEQPISSELRANSSTVQQHSAANKSTHNPTFLKNPLDQLGKRKADFDRTEQNQIKVYNQLLELTDKKCKNVEENEQAEELQTSQSNISNPILLSHSQKMRIVKLVESANSYDLKRINDAKNDAKNEKDAKKRHQIQKRARMLRIYFERRMDLLNHFKEEKATPEEIDSLFTISRTEERRLQDFANVQQQFNEPGPSRSDTSKPVSELEQYKTLIQQLNREEEYLKSKWKESQQERRNKELLREQEQSPEKIEWEQEQQKIREKEYNAELQELHKTKQMLERILEQKRLEPQQLDQLEKDKQETITLTQANSQSQLQASAQPGSSQIDISTSPEQDDNEIVSFENDEKFDALIETILDAPCESDDVTITSPQQQTINWWTELAQKFKDSFTAIPPDPISAAEIRTKIRQEAKSRQEERVRLKKVAGTKSELLKQKEKWVQDLKKEQSKLWNQWCDNNMQLPEDLHKRFIEIRDLLVKAKLERNQLRENVRGLKYYFKKLTDVLGAIVDAYVWLRDGFSAPGFRYEVENSFENQRKNALNNLLPSLIEKEAGAYSENALDRVKTEFFEITGINLKDRKNLTEFNKSLEKCRNLRVELQSWQVFSDQVDYAKEIRAAQKKQADSTPSGMAEKNARDEAASRAELDYLAQTLPQRLVEADLIRLQQAHNNRMSWMQQNSHKFSQIEPSNSSSKLKQQKQQSRLQDSNNSTATNFAQASVRSRQVQKVQENQMTLETAMKLWSHSTPKFKSDAEMFTSANILDRAVKIMASDLSRFKPTPSSVEQAVSAINRNTTRIITSYRATSPNNATYTAAKPMSPRNVSEQKKQQKKSTKTPVLE